MGLVVFGVDPGFAGQGIAVLHQEAPGQEPHVLFASSTKTEKRANKRKRDLRVSADDQRRFKELWESLEFARKRVGRQPINAMCIEVYSPYKEATSAAAKAGAAYGGATYWGLSQGMIIIPAVPQDIKRGICGRLSASKKDVQEEIVRLIPELASYLQKTNKTQREHMADAAAHAYVGLAEMWELRQMLGSSQQTAF
jgi:Holliday junction resolvasome RuvABC endonuclease subunit